MALKRRVIGGGDAAPSSFRVRKRPVRQIETGEGAGKPKFKLTGEVAEFIGTLRKQKKLQESSLRQASTPGYHVGRLRTGILTADLCLAGGWKMSRGAMIYGEKSAGKSTTALLTIAAAQRQYPDQVCIWIDIEGTFDAAWARKLGVDLERLIIHEPASGEEAVDIAAGLAYVRESSVIVTDSIAFLTPQKEIDSSAEDFLVGVHARLIGTYLRRLNSAMLAERKRRHDTLILHLNQFRMKIGGLNFGDPRTLPGGKALEFSTSQQMLMRNKEIKGKDDDDDEIVIRNEHEFTITKDKTGGRMKEGAFNLIRDASTGLPEGYIDQAKTVIKFGVKTGLIEASPGARFWLDKKQYHGQEALADYLRQNADREMRLMDEIVNHYRDKWKVS